MSGYQETEFLGADMQSPSGRKKAAVKHIGQKLEAEDGRPDVWVCRDQNPEPQCLRKKSWKTVRVIQHQGVYNKEWGAP